MARPAATLLFVSACVIGAALPLDGGQPLTMRVTPAMAPEPAIVRVTVIVEADDRNRSLEIAAWSDNYLRRSQIQLEGREARHVYEFEFRDVPHGRYEVRGLLTGTDGRRAEVTRLFMVVSPIGR